MSIDLLVCKSLGAMRGVLWYHEKLLYTEEGKQQMMNKTWSILFIIFFVYVMFVSKFVTYGGYNGKYIW